MVIDLGTITNPNELQERTMSALEAQRGVQRLPGDTAGSMLARYMKGLEEKKSATKETAHCPPVKR